MKLKEDLLALTKTSSELATFETVSAVSTQRSRAENNSKLSLSPNEAERESGANKPKDSNGQEEESAEEIDKNIGLAETGGDDSPEDAHEVDSGSCIPVTRLKDIPTLLFGMYAVCQTTG